MLGDTAGKATQFLVNIWCTWETLPLNDMRKCEPGQFYKRINLSFCLGVEACKASFTRWLIGVFFIGLKPVFLLSTLFYL